MPFVNDGFAKQDPAGGGGGGGSSDASDLTSGTLADARLSAGILNATYQHNQYVLTTGTATAYVATPTVAIALADGAEILCGIHATSGASPTLNVSGTGARAIYKEGAAGLTAVGTGQLLSGPNIYKFTYNAGFGGWVVSSPLFLQADDLPTGIDAAKIGDGSVSTTEFQYISTLSSNAQTQINAKQAALSSSSKLGLDSGGTNADLSATGGSGHVLKQASAGAAVTVGALAAGDLPTGIDAAKLADGTVSNSDIQAIKDLATTGGTGHFLKQNSVGGAITSEVPSATDSTKLPIDGSGSMTGALAFTTTQTSAGAAIANIFRDSSGNLTTNLATGAEFGINNNDSINLRLGPPGIAFYATNTSAGASVASIYRDSSGYLNYNVASNKQHWFYVSDSLRFVVGDVNNYSARPLLFGSAGRDNGGYWGQLHSNNIGGVIGLESLAANFAFMAAGGAPGGTKAGVEVYGASHASNPGAVAIKSEGVTRTNSGSWTAIYSLSAGTHTGNFTLSAYRVTGDSHAVNVCWEIEGTTLNGPYSPNASSEWDWSFVAAGSAAAGNISLRVNSGNIEINVGTSVESDIKFSIQFQGMVN